TRIFGVAGSPTRVEGLRSEEVKREARLFEGDLTDSVRSLVAALGERGAFAPQRRSNPVTTAAPRRTTDPSRALWVIAEVLAGRLRRVSLELLGKAVELSAQSGGRVSALLLGHAVRGHAPELAAHGADSVLVCDDPLLA